MTAYYWAEDDEALDREAMAELVKRHRAEYDEIVAGSQKAEVERLEEQCRKNLRRIRELEEKLTKAEVDKKRWAQRVADGITEKSS